MGPVLLQDDWVLGERGVVEGTCFAQDLPLFGGAPEPGDVPAHEQPLGALLCLCHL